MKTSSTTYNRLPQVALQLMLLAVLLASCYRDDLCYLHPDGARIQLEIDWSYAKLSPNSATAVIFKDGQYFTTEVFSAYPPVRKVINLPVGKYSFVVFDEQISDYEESINFIGMNRFETFEARSVDDFIANAFTKVPTRTLKSNVDTLAVDRIIDFEITHEMLNHNHIDPTPIDQATGGYTPVDITLRFLPKRVFTIANVVVNVKNGAGYYFTQRNPAILHGTAESYFLGAHKYSEHTVSHPIKFTQPYLSRNGSDATFTSTLHIVGLTDYLDSDIPVGSMSYILTLPFTYSGGIIVKDIDLISEAKKFSHTMEEEHDLPYHAVDIEVDIELPELIIVGGMDVGLDEWTDVDIPLDGPQRVYFYSNNGNKEMFWWQNLPGTTINLPQPLFTPVDGLKFVGWNTEADGTGTSYIAGDELQMKKGNYLFYAIWEQVELPLQTITFHSNNGYAETIESRQKPGALVPMPTLLFSAPPGKKFDHWNTSADGLGNKYYIGDRFRMPAKDVSIHAVWK